MNKKAIEYLDYLENSDPFFYENFKDFIAYANGLNKYLRDEEYDDLKEATEIDYKIALKDKKTSINIIKNFFYKISPNIIKQIDYDVENGNIVFLSKEEMGDVNSRVSVDGDNYRIEILESNKLDEVFLLVREYAYLFSGELLNLEGYEEGLKKVYVEMIMSLTEFALAKHLSTNNSLRRDSINYIYKKLYGTIYDMNESYLTLMYLGFLLEDKAEDEIKATLGDAEMVSHLDDIITNKKPCNSYIDTLGTMIALKAVNNNDDVFDLVNNLYITVSDGTLEDIQNEFPINLNEQEGVEEITYYIRNSK
ncbi:MAG: hypothetical protein IJ193_08630 [Bacilli bacterium]|nr:hypothetical protein [Bacilli bacterium]